MLRLSAEGFDDKPEPLRTAVVRTVGFQGMEREKRLGLVFTGEVRVPADDMYTFHVTSDDGGKLVIGDGLVVDHDGAHGPSERMGQIAVRRGFHPITVRFFEAGGGRALRVLVSRDGDQRPRAVDDRLYRGREPRGP